MGTIFVSRHPAIADLQHVRIVPVPGPNVRIDIKLTKADAVHRLPAIADVPGGAPQIAPDFAAPRPHIIATVLAEAEYDGSASFEQRIAHFLVHGLHFGVLVNAVGTAPV